jgi:hypothetical protein
MPKIAIGSGAFLKAIWEKIEDAIFFQGYQNVRNWEKEPPQNVSGANFATCKNA